MVATCWALRREPQANSAKLAAATTSMANRSHRRRMPALPTHSRTGRAADCRRRLSPAVGGRPEGTAPTARRWPPEYGSLSLAP